MLHHKPYRLSLALCALLATTACSPSATHKDPETQLSDATLVAPKDPLMPDQLVAHWHFDGQPTEVDLYLSSSTELDQARLLAKAVSGNSYVLDEAAEGPQYLYIQPANGEGRWVGRRLLPLEGGHNFRDLGGYPAENGRHVQWGKLYRSGTMVGLTDRDYQYLDQLGVRVLCDFRSAEERQAEPTRWQQFAREGEYLAKDYSMRELMSGSEGGDWTQLKTAEDAQAMFKGFYRAGPYTFKDQYTRMFDELVQGNAPLAFQCSAGKDRTGMAAALILTALEVPREIVVQDYALSEKVSDHGQRQRRESEEDAPHSGVAAMPAEAREVLMGSDPMFIKAMFDELEKNHGSAMAYIQTELEVSDTELARLRELYLTD